MTSGSQVRRLAIVIWVHTQFAAFEVPAALRPPGLRRPLWPGQAEIAAGQ